MSFTAYTAGKAFVPGWFMVEGEPHDMYTRQMAQAVATTNEDGTKVVKMGTIWPSNDANAVGIVYEDIDVTNGDMPGSVLMSGKVYEDRLPIAIDTDARAALTAKGFVFIEKAPAVSRPY